ncbi:MAG: arsenite methyltransferase [Hyphomicrobiales bacterium]|nr:arsenite methyltransferase [Hyphomicrobiales bacterium]
MEHDVIRTFVRERYAEVVKPSAKEAGCCAPQSSSPETSAGTGCCAPGGTAAGVLGYSDEERALAPDGADLGLGCGNPNAIAELKAGEVVLDLGSGAGFDAFIAAKAVGETGRVIGVDMTPDMLIQARENARKVGAENVEFRLGEIEHLPVADGTVDAIMSNCVINLSPAKAQVFRDAYRVLKPGGRLAISDVVATAPLPESLRDDKHFIAGCMGGCERVEDMERMLADAGFSSISIDVNEASREFIKEWAPGSGVEAYVASAVIKAVKP